MTTITQIQEDKFSVSDGRSIIKEGANWYVLNEEGRSDFGPVTSFDSVIDYIDSPLSTQKNDLVPQDHANKGPAVLWAVVMLVVCLLLLFIRNY